MNYKHGCLILKKWLLPFFLVCSFCLAAAVEYIPQESKISQVSHKYFSLGYREEFEQAAWTHYLFKKKYLSGQVSRSNRFKEDPYVLTDSAKPEEYYYSGFDRGHLVPAGDMKISTDAMRESFYMSNISPQKSYFNRSIWRSLEYRVRSWVRQKGDLHVFTGPIFSKKPEYIRGTSIAIPSGFYKIILQETKSSFRAIAFYLPHQRINESIDQFVVTIDEIEKKSGIDFLSELPDKVENELESKIITNGWL